MAILVPAKIRIQIMPEMAQAPSRIVTLVTIQEPHAAALIPRTLAVLEVRDISFMPKILPLIIWSIRLLICDFI